MDKERQKRMQNLRLIITEAIMTVVAVIMVIVLTFVAMGYKLGQGGELSQNGLLQVSSNPTGATVTIDGDTLFARTDTSRSLSAGEHTVELTRAGYDNWQKTITIRSGWLYKLDYPRLFKTERETERVQDFDRGLEFISMAPDRNSILYADEDSLTWQWLRVRGNEVERKEIKIAEVFGLDEKVEKFPGMIQEISWNGDGDRVLVDYANNGTRYDIIVNLSRVENSLNLTTAFGMDFSKVLPVTNSAERLVVLENGNLRTISTGNKEMSQILVANVADFVNLGSEILFVTAPNEEGMRTINYYVEGNKTPVVLETVAGDGVKMAISKYLDERYLTIAIGPEISIYKATELHEESTVENLNLVKQVSMAVAPTEVEVHNRGRLIVALNEKRVLVFDAEQGEIAEYELESEPAGWLDGFILTNIVDDKLVVRDFDGANRRELMTVKSGFSAMIASNERYLYYVTECGDGVANRSCLQRDKL